MNGQTSRVAAWLDIELGLVQEHNGEDIPDILRHKYLQNIMKNCINEL